MSVCSRCEEQLDFFSQLKEYLIELGYNLQSVSPVEGWCCSVFEQRYRDDEDIRLRLTIQSCSCAGADLPRIPRLDNKYICKIEADETTTDHGYSNSFRFGLDLNQLHWVLMKETNRALHMFDGDKEFREMIHEMRDW